MELVNPSHIKNLKELIGKDISVVYLPDLFIRNFADHQIEGVESKSQLFYESTPVNIKISDGSDFFWIIIQAEDSNEKFRTKAEKSKSPNLNCHYGEIGYGDGDSLKAQKRDLRPARLSLWEMDGNITQVEIHRIGSDTAYLIQHESGKTWCIYTQFDWGCWMSFDEDICQEIKEQSLEKMLVI